MGNNAIKDTGRSIACKQLDLVCQRYSFSFVSGLLISSTLVAMLWPLVAHSVLLAWLLSLWSVMVARNYHARRYLRLMPDVDLGKWRSGLVAGAAAAGACWGLSVFFLSVSPLDPAALPLIFVIAGVSAFVSVTMAAERLAVVAFLLTALLPLALWLALSGDRLHVYMALITLTYTGLMLLFSREIHRLIRNSLSTPEQNWQISAAIKQVRALEHAAARQESERCYSGQFANLEDNIFFLDFEEQGGFTVASINPAEERSFGLIDDELQSLRKSETQFRTLTENALDPIYRYDRDCRRIYANPAVMRLSGQPLASLLGKRPTEAKLVSSDESVKVELSIQRVLDTGMPDEIEVLFVAPDGRELYFQNLHIPEFGEDGTVESVLSIGRDITARKYMEEVLLKSEREYRTLSENSPDNIIRYDRECRICYLNKNAATALALSAAYMLRKTSTEVFSDGLFDELELVLKSVIESGQPAEHDVVLPDRGEGERYQHLRMMPEKNERGEVTGVLSIGRDITEQKRNERTLIEKEQRLSSFVSSAPGFFFTLLRRQDGSMAMPFASVGITDIFGLLPEELALGVEPLVSRYHPDDVEVVQRKVALSGQNLEPCHAEFRALNRQKGERWVEARSMPHRDEAGNTFWYGYMQDITERKAMENALHDSKYILKEAQRIAHVGSWNVDLVNDKLVWSEEIFRIWEIDKAQFEANFAAFTETVHPEDRNLVSQAFNDAVINHSLYEVEHRLLFPDGRIKHILERGEPQYDAEGKPVRFIGTSLDITERKFAEQYEHFRSRTLELLAGDHALPAILEEIVRGVEQLNPKMLCSILLLDEQSKHLVGGIAPSLPDFYNEAINGMEIGMGAGSCGTAAASGERVIVADIQTHPYWVPFKDLAVRAGLGACWSQPILASSGRVLGTFAIYHREAHAPAARDISLIEKIAYLASIAIERKRMEETLANRERDFHSLAENLPDNIARWDAEGRYLYVNPTHEHTLGVSASELIGRPLPDTHEHVKAAIAQVVATGLVVELVRQTVPVDGELQIHEVSLVPERDATGRIVSVLGLGRNMTEFYRMQDEVVAREAEFRSLAENISDHIVRFDVEGRYLYINPTHEHLLGAPVSELPAMTFVDSDEPLHAAFRRAIATGQPMQVEQRVPVADDFEIHSINLTPEFDEDGKLVSVLAVGRDMTENYRMQDEVVAREAEFRSLAENIPDHIVRFDVEGRYLYINPMHERLLGAPVSELPAMTFVDSDKPLHAAFRQVIATGEPMQIEQRVPVADDFEIHSINMTPEFDEDGKLVSVLVVGRNMTEFYRMQETIAVREQEFRSLAENLPTPIFRYGTDGRRIYVNPAVFNISGKSAESLLGQTPADARVVSVAYADNILAGILRVVETRQPFEHEVGCVKPDGTELSFINRLVPEFDLNGNVVSVLAIASDITERKQMEQALEKAHWLLHSVLQGIPDPVWMKDADGAFVVCNSGVARLFNMSVEEIIGKTDYDFFDTEMAEFYRNKDRMALEAGRVCLNEESWTFGDNGEQALMETRKVPVMAADGKLLGVLGVARDITERKRTEEVLEFIAQGEWLSGGEAFLPALVRYLGKTLGVDYVIVDRFAADTAYVETMVLYAREEILPNMQYALQGTPCSEVMAGKACCYADDVRGLFPDSSVLAKMQAESYVGVPLLNVEGRVIGLIAALDSQPMADTHAAMSMLKLVAASAAAELVRTQMEGVLRDSHESLNEAQRISHVGSWELDLASGALLWSDEIYCIFEIDSAQFGATYEAFLNAIHPDDREAVNQAYRESLENRAPYEIEHRLSMADGRIKYVLERCETDFAEDGKPLRSRGTVHDVTGGVLVAQALRQSEAQYRYQSSLLTSMLDSAADVSVWSLDCNYRYLSFNAQHVENSKRLRSGDIAVGMSPLDVINREELRETALQAFERVLDGHSLTVEIQEELVQEGKLTYEYYEHHGSPIKNEAGEVVGLTFFTYDITERKQAERDIEIANSRLSGVLQTIPDLVWLKDMAGVYLSCNPAFERFFGAKEAEIIGKTDYDFVDVELADFFRQKDLEAIAANRICINEEWVTFAEDNRRVLLEVRKMPLRDTAGNATGVLGISHDITERRAIEEMLQNSEYQLQEAQRIAHLGSWKVDLVNDKLVWSEEVFRIWEIDKAQFEASFAAFTEMVHPEDRERVTQAFNDAVINHSLYEVEHRLLFPDGRIKHILERGEPQYDAEGKPVRFIGTSLDITEHKRAEFELQQNFKRMSRLNVHLELNARDLEEQAQELEMSKEQLQQTEAWYRSIMHSAPDGMLIVDSSGFIMQVNAQLEAMFGYYGGELPGRTIEVLIPEAARAGHVAQRNGFIFSGERDRRMAGAAKDLFGRRKDGSEFPVDVSLSRLPDLAGRVGAICASVRDVSERQKMEVLRETALSEALRLARMRSVFMAQMSHELRTPLNGILGYAQNLLQEPGIAEKQVAGLNIIQQSGDHLLLLINGILDHAAIEADKLELIPGDIQLDPFLSAIIGIIRIRAEQKNISFACDAGADLPAVVRGDAQRLRQVLLNLLANAVKFTDSGQVTLRVSYSAPSRLRFAVQDSGVGIDAEQLENIFLPFEQVGEISRRAGGTGLGLAISRKLVRLMGGDISVESLPGAGSTFSFEIEMDAVDSDSARVNAASLSELAVTNQITPSSFAPPAHELDILHKLALRGSMRDVMRHADRLLDSDARYLDFVGQMRQLTESFQTKALLRLIEQYRKGTKQ